jgi:hypothetical protein
MWNKEFVTNDQKTIYDYQNIKYYTTKTWKELYWMNTCKIHI